MSPEIAALDLRHERWARMFVATVRLPGGGTTLRDVEDHGQAVAVLPYDPELRAAPLVRQFRAQPFHAAGEADTPEAPAGRLDGSDPAACVRREAIGKGRPPPRRAGAGARRPDHAALSTECAHLFLAPYSAADRVAAGGGLASEHEGVAVVETPLAELAAMADAGALAELKLFALVQTLRLRRPELFAAR